MEKTVMLHGGPLHGKVYTFPESKDHYHVAVAYQATPDHAPVPRDGTYSSAHGSQTDYEWDGFTS